MINAKQKIFNKIVKMPKNFHFVAGNVLNMNDIQKCLKHFDLSKPIAVINQELIRYLEFDEKRVLTNIIYNTIKPNKGIWLTCDFTPISFIKSQDNNLSDCNNYNRNLSKVTYRNNASWRFKNKDYAEQFVKPIGLKMEWHEFTESLSMLSSIRVLKQTENKVGSYLKDAYVSVLTANKD